MFHWICPECGREIPPNVRECGACDPKAATEDSAAAASPQIEVPELVPAVVPETPAEAPEVVPAAPIPVDPEGLRQMAIALGILDDAPVTAPEPVVAPEPVASVPAPVASVAEPLEAAPETAPVVALVPASEAPHLQVAVTVLPPPPEVVALAESEPALEPAPEPAPAPEPSAPGPLLTLFPLQLYSPGARRAIQPAVPKRRVLMPDSGPRITLPGPVLPPALESLENAGMVSVVGAKVRPPAAGVPGWLVSLLVALALFLAAVTAVFSLLSHSSADAKPAAQAQAVPEDNPVQPESYPLAKYIEVTGFRIVVDLNKKSEIHYLAVNHSPARLSDLNVFVTLRSTGAKPGQPPICRFSFRAPDLGPFESKEMISSIEKLSRPVAVPEWQDLRADIQIAQ